MHLYERPDRSVYSSTAVDVEIDGWLQHGHVINITEAEGASQRLLVDFGSPPQKPVLVEYGNIFDCSVPKEAGLSWLEESQEPPSTSQAVVEVLLRDHPLHPWRWYPATIVKRVSLASDYAVVDVMMAGHRYRELLPSEQIRLRSGKDELEIRRLLPGHFCFFVKTDGPYLPRKYLSTVTIEKKRAQRYRMGERKPKRRLLAMTVHRPRGDATQSDDTGAYGDQLTNNAVIDGYGIPLPVELLKEIFLSLDTVDQQRCCRVCVLWEEIIHTPELCAIVRARVMDTFYPQAQQVWHPDYMAYSCVFEHITTETRTICLEIPRSNYRDRREGYEPSNAKVFALKLIQEILDDAGVRIERLVMYRRWQDINLNGHPFSQRLHDVVKQYAGFATCCKRIVWADCYRRFVEGRNNELFMSFHFRQTAFNLSCIDVADMWDRFEENLLLKKPLSLSLLTRWTNKQIKLKSAKHCLELAKILDMYQTCDPRPFAHYYAQTWSVDNLVSLELDKLNRICLYAVSRYVHCEQGASAENNPEDSDEEASKAKEVVREFNVVAFGEEANDDAWDEEFNTDFYDEEPNEEVDDYDKEMQY
ncbi:uncharacterized protein LOC129599553 isoform X2 [Paramacrobiotus metropolitanus]|uniref:uncharacterized protein LOC129599553 isoform X2 n=1 Tax=Paramacrobiotus metropolitanus TaxID=2943436 RepID=UPI002445821C|nr:uncharacterized protein LOC129599553 isoform X2 [Paramacrobiotus metropolitanus]